jgi:ribonuclease HI
VEKRLTIYTDGCSKGNPGRAGIGVLIYQDDTREPFCKLSHDIGVTTNNQAEYKALIAALEYAVKVRATDVKIKSDSELIVNQMNGRYRVKNVELQALHAEAKRLSGLINNFSIRSIPREQNREADELANRALK